MINIQGTQYPEGEGTERLLLISSRGDELTFYIRGRIDFPKSVTQITVPKIKFIEALIPMEEEEDDKTSQGS